MKWITPRLVFLMFAAAALSVVGFSQTAPPARGPLIRPLAVLTKDFEVIYGDPDAEGQPFVMRIRELPGRSSPRTGTR
jgi:hypothetical protein